MRRIFLTILCIIGYHIVDLQEAVPTDLKPDDVSAKENTEHGQENSRKEAVEIGELPKVILIPPLDSKHTENEVKDDDEAKSGDEHTEEMSSTPCLPQDDPGLEALINSHRGTNAAKQQPSTEPDAHPDAQPGLQPDVQPEGQTDSQQDTQPDNQYDKEAGNEPATKPGSEADSEPTIETDKQPHSEPDKEAVIEQDKQADVVGKEDEIPKQEDSVTENVEVEEPKKEEETVEATGGTEDIPASVPTSTDPPVAVDDVVSLSPPQPPTEPAVPVITPTQPPGAGEGGAAETTGTRQDVEEEMLSFDEWKQLKLREEKSKQRQQQQEAAGLHPAGSPSSPGSSRGGEATAAAATPTKAKAQHRHANRVNFAAASCGAKVLAANPEAQSTSAVLTENKDKYMIQPCKAKKWFIVELCEPVQVTSLEIGNLEFFSSQTRSFNVLIADRFPSKEWASLGVFAARDERVVQSFPVSDETSYAKYVKVEVTAHYGEEHYCPLTVVRVYGTTVHEEEDEADESDDAADDDDTDAALLDTADGDGKAASLLEMAIDTAQRMVKDVLSPASADPHDPADPAAADPAAAVEEQGSAGVNQTAANTTNVTQPCAPDVSNGAGPHSASSGGAPSDQPRAPNTTIPASPLVRLIETPPPRSRRWLLSSVMASIVTCQFCTRHDKVSRSCYFDHSSLCGYYRALTFVYPTCCVVDAARRKHKHTVPGPRGELDLHTVPVVERGPSIDQDKSKGTSAALPAATARARLQPDIAASTVLTDGARTETPGGSSGQQTEPLRDAPRELTASPITLTTAPAATTPAQPTTSQSVAGKASESILHTVTREEDLRTADVTTLEASPVATPGSASGGQRSAEATLSLEAGHATTEAGEDAKQESVAAVTAPDDPPSSVAPDSEAAAACDAVPDDPGCPPMGPDTIQIRTGATEDGSAATKVDELASKPAPAEAENDPAPAAAGGKPDDAAARAGGEKVGGGQQPVDGGQQSGHSHQNGNGEKIIYAEERKPEKEDLDLQMVEPPSGDGDDDSAPVTRRPGVKETTYMKLRNRIRDLELNLNLSSRYFEELTRRHKKQQDETFHSLNRTVERLRESARQTTDKDASQEAVVAALTEQVSQLNSSLGALREQYSELMAQVLLRHSWLLLGQTLVFVCLLLWLSRWRGRGGVTEVTEEVTRRVMQQLQQQQATFPASGASSSRASSSRRGSVAAQPKPTPPPPRRATTLTPAATSHTKLATVHRDKRYRALPTTTTTTSPFPTSSHQQQNGRVVTASPGLQPSSVRRRRNSSDGTPARSPLLATTTGGATEKQRSLDDMALMDRDSASSEVLIVEPNLRLFIFDDDDDNVDTGSVDNDDVGRQRLDGHKKKKKKGKQKGLVKSQSLGFPLSGSSSHSIHQALPRASCSGGFSSHISHQVAKGASQNFHQTAAAAKAAVSKPPKPVHSGSKLVQSGAKRSLGTTYNGAGGVGVNGFSNGFSHSDDEVEVMKKNVAESHGKTDTDLGLNGHSGKKSKHRKTGSTGSGGSSSSASSSQWKWWKKPHV